MIKEALANIIAWLFTTGVSKFLGLDRFLNPGGKGGMGGGALSIKGGWAVGGRGGRGGIGNGGDGGKAKSIGKGSFSMGGEGGEAAQKNQGGSGGRGPLHVLMEEYPEKFKEISKKFGITKEMAKKIGKGGDGQ
ncbi:MAG: hypothetical protein WC489_01305 [Patescibacteria group bacterium]